jgi:hypothetical protein
MFVGPSNSGALANRSTDASSRNRVRSQPASSRSRANAQPPKRNVVRCARARAAIYAADRRLQGTGYVFFAASLALSLIVWTLFATLLTR